MARTSVPITAIVRTGVPQPTLFATGNVADGMKVAENTGRVLLEMINASNASPVNVTFDIPVQYDGDLSITDIIVALAAGQTKYAGPFKTGVFNQIGSTDNALHFDVSSSGVVFRAYSLEPNAST